jgi:perosamine synthetase
LGGMLTTNDKKLADIARSVRFHGEDKARGTQDRLGNDWSLSEVQAVVGLQQTKRLKDIVRKRMAIAKRYDKAFRGIENISLFTLPPNTVHSYYKYLILCKSLAYKQRLKERLKKKGIATGSLYWPPLHLQPAYKKLFKHKKGDFKVADDILPRVLALPMYTGMTKKEQDYVIKEFKICG